MKKRKYETPSVSLSRIEIESSICSASAEVTNPGPENAGIDEHKTNTDFSGDFSGGSWDTDPTL